MGCTAAIQQTHQISMQTNVVSLAVCDKTQQLIQRIDKMGSAFNCNAPLNFKGDTLLHYACARKNYELVSYLANRNDIICSVRNRMDQTPLDLVEGDDELATQIRKICS